MQRGQKNQRTSRESVSTTSKRRRVGNDFGKPIIEGCTIRWTSSYRRLQEGELDILCLEAASLKRHGFEFITGLAQRDVGFSLVAMERNGVVCYVVKDKLRYEVTSLSMTEEQYDHPDIKINSSWQELIFLNPKSHKSPLSRGKPKPMDRRYKNRFFIESLNLGPGPVEASVVPGACVADANSVAHRDIVEIKRPGEESFYLLLPIFGARNSILKSFLSITCNDGIVETGYNDLNERVVLKGFPVRSSELPHRGPEDRYKEVAVSQYLERTIPIKIAEESDETVKQTLIEGQKHICKIYDCVSDGHMNYIIMPEFKMGSLCDNTVLMQNNSQTVSRNTIRFRNMYKGIKLMHRCGVCHMDISLDNIVVDNEGNFVLIDFGACILVPLSENGNGAFVTEIPSFATGKVPNQAPEVFGNSPTMNPFLIDAWMSAGIGIYIFIRRGVKDHINLMEMSAGLRDHMLNFVSRDLLAAYPYVVGGLERLLERDPSRRISCEAFYQSIL